MKIKDLPAPVTATKADWLPGTTWLGFTPQGRGVSAAARCQSTVQRQFGNGYVLERITQSFGEPNPAFKNDPRVLADRAAHESLKDRLVAVHRLRTTARPLRAIIGEAEYERLQDIWASGADRRRWSVAFPIVETYEIVGRPEARTVFDQVVFRQIYQTQSATLRALDNSAREAIAELEIIRTDADNAWIAIEDELLMAEHSELPPRLQRHIYKDLNGALEGEPEERVVKLRKRAVWLANKFAHGRRAAGTLICDDCGFNPSTLPDFADLSPRSCFDVHHKAPMEEGRRYTTITDFALLCPTCHRLAHMRLRNVAKR